MLRSQAKRKRILITEDDPSSLNLMNKFMQRFGYDAVLAPSGEIALELLDESIDLVLLDIMLPGLDGIEVLKEIRLNDRFKFIPVVMLTALTGHDCRLKAINEGANDYISKPVNGCELESRLLLVFKLVDAQKKLNDYHTKMVLLSRMESIGQLAAGIAHEINTPLQYVENSISFLKTSFDDYQHFKTMTCQAISREENLPQGIVHTMNNLMQEFEMDFLEVEIPNSFKLVADGLGRIKTLIDAMRCFSHPGSASAQKVDVIKLIENALSISKNEYKYFANVTTEFYEESLCVECQAGEITQVLLNLIVNAVHSIQDALNCLKTIGTIAIKAEMKDDFVHISIKDNGKGIPKQIQGKVFDLFFTTKELGKGSGQGLAIAYDIVVKKHCGTITFETEEGKGTTFLIRLPVKDRHSSLCIKSN